MKKGVIYVRESTSRQDWKTQLLECRAYCRKFNINVEESYEFVEQASGAKNDRKYFLEIESMILKKEFDVLVVWELSRSTRDFFTYKTLIRDMMDNDIELHSLQEGLLTEDDIDKEFSNDILALLNSRERKIVGRRIKTRLSFLRETGQWSGGKPPLGYSSINGKLVPNKDADVVKEIFQLYLRGNSIMNIANIFGIKDPKKVGRILNNSLYTGKIVSLSEIVNDRKKIFETPKIYEGIHEPLIDEDTFMLAASMRKNNQRRDLSGNYLLSNVYCFCGTKMYPSMSNEGIVSFQCSKDNYQVRSTLLEKQVF